MLLQLRSHPHDALPTPSLPPDSKKLDRLRRAARVARLSQTPADCMAALIQSLEAVIGKRLVFFEDSAGEASFDESWLLNLFDAVRQGDTDRYCFALRSRMGRMDAAEVHFSVCKAALTLDR